MMNRLRSPWIGLFGGAAFWYAAHDLGTYFSATNCHHPWIAPTIQIIAFFGALLCGFMSYRRKPDEAVENPERLLAFGAMIGLSAASLFALAILWQGIATFIYSGCER